MTAFRLIRTHLCPLLLAASMLALAACGTKVREPVVQAPPPPPVVVVAPPEEEPPVLPPPPDKYFEANVTKVGLLLPLSGRNSALGQAMLDSAQLALFDVQDPTIVLLPRDTEGAGGAAAAAEDAIRSGARILLGPIFADAIRAAGPVARQFRVPLVGFSTDRTVAGDGVYILGFTPQQQVERIVRYSIDQGWKRLAALVPQSPYGTMVAEAMREAAARYGGQLVAIETFPETEEALAPPVQRLAARKVQVPSTEPLPPPVPGAPPYVPQPVFEYQFDAVLIATGGGLLRTLAPMLPYYDVDPAKVKFLGTGLWDDPSLRGEDALAGALYAGPPPETGATFSSHYGRTYGGTAPRVSSIAYDAVALVAALKKMHPDRPFAASALSDPKGFAGIDGVFRFGPGGVAERGLAVIQITPAGMMAVDPAPQEFGPAR
ncbi:MAG: penicillin-binding protein activator [Sphingomonadales bacterium]